MLSRVHVKGQSKCLCARVNNQRIHASRPHRNDDTANCCRNEDSSSGAVKRGPVSTGRQLSLLILVLVLIEASTFSLVDRTSRYTKKYCISYLIVILPQVAKMLSRISSFDDLATWEDSVSHGMPLIVVDPLEESEDPVDPPSMYVLVTVCPFDIFTWLP